MTKNKKTINDFDVAALSEDRGLSPVSSGTPMPKTKPAKKENTSTEKNTTKKEQ